jgi:hypothetical protein
VAAHHLRSPIQSSCIPKSIPPSYMLTALSQSRMSILTSFAQSLATRHGVMAPRWCSSPKGSIKYLKHCPQEGRRNARPRQLLLVSRNTCISRFSRHSLTPCGLVANLLSCFFTSPWVYRYRCFVHWPFAIEQVVMCRFVRGQRCALVPEELQPEQIHYMYDYTTEILLLYTVESGL